MKLGCGSNIIVSMLQKMAWLTTVFSLIPMVVNAQTKDTGINVVVVYNAKMPESKDVAKHYAERRFVPENQVIGLDLPTTETMSRSEYNQQLFLPLAKQLSEKHLIQFKAGSGPLDSTKSWSVSETSIRYVVLCYGVPLKITEDASLKESDAEKFQLVIRRNGASVDSELALLPMGGAKTLTGPFANPFYGATNSASLNPVNGLLMVTRLDGPSAAIARALVDKAIQAETDGLWGRAYFDARGLPTNSPLFLGDKWICASAGYTVRFGFQTVLDTNEATFPITFPMSQIAFYAGWYNSTVNGPFTLPKVEFMPGAFAYHLHSFSAVTIRSTNSAWVGPLLNAGVTATMGCVEEPFLQCTPDIAVFFNRWLAPAYSFGEAAYVCQPALSWQTTVVGDPLYRPFSKPPQVLHQELQSRGSKLIEWSHARVIGLNVFNGTTPDEMVAYLNAEPITAKSAVLSELLGDIYLRQNKLDMAIGTYKQALELSPTPQQKVRLVLGLGNVLGNAGRENEAFALYDKFYKETPDYCGAQDFCKEMESFASKLKKSAEAKFYKKELKRFEKAAKAAADKK